VLAEHISGTFRVILVLKTWEGEILIEWKNKRDVKRQTAEMRKIKDEIRSKSL
jgi:hypothetical protein